MTTVRRRPASTGLLILVLIVLLLMGLIIAFSHQILSNLARMDAQGGRLALLAAVALPVALTGFILLQVLRLMRERARRKPGALLKGRLLAFFAFVALLSSIPQMVLAITFINSSLRFWLEARIGEALKGGLDMALQTYHGLVKNLSDFSGSGILPILLRDLDRNPERSWKAIREANSFVNLLLVIDPEGREFFFRGDPRGRLEDPRHLEGVEGALPKEDREGASILRHVFRQLIRGKRYTVIIGTVLPEGFDQRARTLSESIETFNQLGRYQQLFRLVLIAFYFFFSLPIFLLTILVSLILAEELTRPLANLEEATRRIAGGDFSYRILTRTGDELSALAESFNRMTQELAASRVKLLKAEKISIWQEIAQRLAHEIKNPLTPIKLSAQRILKKYQSGPAEFEKVLEPAISAIIREVDNLNRLLQEFRDFARLPEPVLEPLSLQDLIAEVISTYRHLSPGVRFNIDPVGPALEIPADRNQMRQVFVNLIKNAIQAMPRGGELIIRAEVVKKEDRRYCRIRVRDTGLGIPAEARDQIFQPYFTTKKEGTGLGLAIVERVIFDHQGVIWFETETGSGTTFIIDLPMEG